MVEPRADRQPVEGKRERLERARAALAAITEEIRGRRRAEGEGAAAQAGDAPYVRGASSRPRVHQLRERPATWQSPEAAAARPLPGRVSVDAPLRGLEYAVLDVETTGGSPRRGDRVTEVAVVCVDGEGRLLEERSTLVDPERPIPRFITSITNITDAMVANAPRFADIATDLHRCLRGRVLVAHNASFDWRFLCAELRRASAADPECRRLCTVALSRRLVPEVNRRSLDVVCRYFGIQNDARHRALGDARATSTLLLRLLDRAEEREIRRWGELETLLGARAGKRRRTSRGSASKGRSGGGSRRSGSRDGNGNDIGGAP